MVFLLWTGSVFLWASFWYYTRTNFAIFTISQSLWIVIDRKPKDQTYHYLSPQQKILNIFKEKDNPVWNLGSVFLFSVIQISVLESTLCNCRKLCSFLTMPAHQGTVGIGSNSLQLMNIKFKCIFYSACLMCAGWLYYYSQKLYLLSLEYASLHRWVGQGRTKFLLHLTHRTGCFQRY